MAHKSPLETLIELAQKDTEAAAKHLGKAIRAQEETQSKLTMLLQYRDDYDANFQQRAAAGLSASQYGNFLSFLGKLDEAVSGQKKVISDAVKKVEFAKSSWQQCEKKRLSYRTLDERAKSVQLHKEAKREQKQTDEFAARSYFYKT